MGSAWPSIGARGTDYLPVMELDGDRIRHTTKIWNDAINLERVGCG